MDLPTLPWELAPSRVLSLDDPQHRGRAEHPEVFRMHHKPRHCACCVDSGMHLFREDRRG